MRLSLTKLENIVVIIITIPLMLSPLCLLLLVRLGSYTVNLCTFYFYMIIGKLTSSLQRQEFSLRNMTVTTFTSATQSSSHNLNRKSATSSLSCGITDYFEYRWITCVVQITHSPITLANLSANPTVMVIQQCSKQSFQPHHAGVSETPPSRFFFKKQIYWENAKFQCKKKRLFTHIVT
jgi:hypothetical protein